MVTLASCAVSVTGWGASMGCDPLVESKVSVRVAVTAVEPSRISLNGGVEVTVSGRNIDPDVRVFVADVEVTTRTVVGDQQVTFLAPPMSAGPHAVVLENPGSRAVMEEGLRYAAERLAFGSQSKLYEGFDAVAFVVGDLNQDYRADLVVQVEDGRALVILNQGLTSTVTMTLAPDPTRHLLDLKDLDLDGQLDLLESNGIRYGRGDGTFDELTTGVLPAPSTKIFAATIGKFNDDELWDVAYFGAPDGRVNSGELAIALGRPGRRGNFEVRTWPERNVQSAYLEALDLSGDGLDDLVLVVNGAMQSVIDPLGAFHMNVVTGWNLGLHPVLARFDVDGDGRQDMLMEQPTSEGVRVFQWARTTGDPSTRFELQRVFDELCPGENVRWITPWRTHPPDILEWDADPTELLFAMCRREGRLFRWGGEQLEYIESLDVPPGAWQTLAADVDGNGTVDLVFGTSEGIDVRYGGQLIGFRETFTPHPTLCFDEACYFHEPVMQFGRKSSEWPALIANQGRVAYARMNGALERGPGVDLELGPDETISEVLHCDLTGDGVDDAIVQLEDLETVTTAYVPITIGPDEWTVGARWTPYDSTHPGRFAILSTHVLAEDLDGDGRCNLLVDDDQQVWWWGPDVGPIATDLPAGLHWRAADVDGNGTPEVYQAQTRLAADGIQTEHVFHVAAWQDGRVARTTVNLGALSVTQDRIDVISESYLERSEDGFDLWVSGFRDDTSPGSPKLAWLRLSSTLDVVEVVGFKGVDDDRTVMGFARGDLDGDGVDTLLLVPGKGFVGRDRSPSARVIPVRDFMLRPQMVPSLDLLSARGLNTVENLWWDLQFVDLDGDRLDDVLIRSYAGGLMAIRNISR